MKSDLTGTYHGKLVVLSRHSSSKKKVRWNVECLVCYTKYDLSTDSIKSNIGGCSSCSRASQPKGINSRYWRGGKYISSIFLSNVKRGARKRNIPCEVTLEDLDSIWEAQEGRCVYTGRKLTLNGDCTASLDRIDSSRGYLKENVQFLHKNVNIAKWAMSEENFFSMIKEIYENVWVENNVSNSLYEEQLSQLYQHQRDAGHLRYCV